METAAAPPAPPVLTRAPSHCVSPSALDSAFAEHRVEVTAVLTRRASSIADDSIESAAARLLPACELHDCVFVGHLATDMDSIASAIGAAEIFGGIASRASEINTETAFALEHFGVPVPPPFLEVAAGRGVCLVDHNQVSQMTPGVDPSAVRGIIDHHAMQKGTLVTDAPIYIDIRPWGSACTIIAHTAVAQNSPLRPSTAGLLLCGILSDTLNLRSPTTTRFDRLLAGLLARLAGVDDANTLAQRLFKAKARMLDTLTPHGLVTGDCKRFDCSNPADAPSPVTRVAFGVVETTSPGDVLAHEAALLEELRAHKAEEGVDFAFLAVVDVVELTSTLLLCGRGEERLAVAALGGSPHGHGLTRLDLGGRVSRKKDFMPPISATILRGGEWARRPAEEAVPPEVFGAVVHECGPRGCILRRLPSSSSLALPLPPPLSAAVGSG